MAEIKKTVATKPAAKEEPVKAAPEVKAVAAEVKAPEKKEVKAEEKAPAKKETKTAAKKTPAKKTSTAKKTVAKKEETEVKTAAKKAAKQVINLQFGGKSYSMEDLQKIAGDVWKYDLHKADEEYTSLELYVKPEESVAYYVFNGDITGSFFI